jgi:hypothetical protein
VCSSDLLSEAIDDGLSGRQPLDTALAAYHARRDACELPIYSMTCDLARLEPPPLPVRSLLAALQGNQPQIDRYLGILAGSVSIDEFFSAENLARIADRRVEASWAA